MPIVSSGMTTLYVSSTPSLSSYVTYHVTYIMLTLSFHGIGHVFVVMSRGFQGFIANVQVFYVTKINYSYKTHTSNMLLMPNFWRGLVGMLIIDFYSFGPEVGPSCWGLKSRENRIKSLAPRFFYTLYSKGLFLQTHWK